MLDWDENFRENLPFSFSCYFYTLNGKFLFFSLKAKKLCGSGSWFFSQVASSPDIIFQAAPAPGFFLQAAPTQGAKNLLLIYLDNKRNKESLDWHGVTMRRTNMLWICIILIWIRILGSVSWNNGSESRSVFSFGSENLNFFCLFFFQKYNIRNYGFCVNLFNSH